MLLTNVLITAPSTCPRLSLVTTNLKHTYPKLLEAAASILNQGVWWEYRCRYVEGKELGFACYWCPPSVASRKLAFFFFLWMSFFWNGNWFGIALWWRMKKPLMSILWVFQIEKNKNYPNCKFYKNLGFE